MYKPTNISPQIKEREREEEFGYPLIYKYIIGEDGGEEGGGGKRMKERRKE